MSHRIRGEGRGVYKATKVNTNGAGRAQPQQTWMAVADQTKDQIGKQP